MVNSIMFCIRSMEATVYSIEKFSLHSQCKFHQTPFRNLKYETQGGTRRWTHTNPTSDVHFMLVSHQKNAQIDEKVNQLRRKKKLN